MQSFLLVGIGGGLGAMGRYGVGLLIGRMWVSQFPWGTLTVNVLGSLFMGLFIGFLARETPEWQSAGRLFFAVGALGGFTTFSSFSLDAITLIERGQIAQALFYVFGSVLIGFVALFLGLTVFRGVGA